MGKGGEGREKEGWEGKQTVDGAGAARGVGVPEVSVGCAGGETPGGHARKITRTYRDNDRER